MKFNIEFGAKVFQNLKLQKIKITTGFVHKILNFENNFFLK